MCQVAGLASLGQSKVLLTHGSHGATFGYQLAAILVTLALAATGGTLAGLLVSWVNPADQDLTAAQLFDDATFWTVRGSDVVSAMHSGLGGAPVLRAHRLGDKATMLSF